MNKFETQPLVSTWLIVEGETLRGVMDNFADRYQAPKFILHITMYSVNVVSDRVEDMRRAVMEVAQDLQPITLKVKDIGFDNNLFMSLFVKFEESEELNQLQGRISQALSRFGDYSFSPHASLLYKEFPEEEKKKLIPTIKLPSSVTFDRLGINVHLNAQKRMDIKNWRIEIL